MPYPVTGGYPSRTRTTTTPMREYTTVLSEPSRKNHSSTESTRVPNTIILEREYNTVLIEPPNKTHAGPIGMGKRTTSNYKPETKATASKRPSTKMATSIKSQRKTDAPRVDVIRIPYDSSPLLINSFPLIRLGRDGVRAKDCVAGEDWLQHFPNMWSLTDKLAFSFKHRHLIGIPAKDLCSSVNENYFMYTCYDGTAGLAQNKYLEKLSKKPMYGDSFLFRTRADSDENGKAIFLHMGSDSVRDLESGGLTKAILRQLLDSMTPGVRKGQN